MSVEVAISSVEFPSKDGKSLIKGLIWESTEDVLVRGIVQIVHGMVEHVARYDSFARFLVKQGYVVCGEDHVGHGLSVTSEQDLGHLPARGKDILVEDVHEMRVLMCKRYGSSVPYFMFGHSMGSFIVRSYLIRYGDGLAGSILSGTAQQPVLMSKAGNMLARCMAAVKGLHYRSMLLHSIGAGAYSKQIPHARTPFDWLSTDTKVVDGYIADNLCGAQFSVGGYAALTELTGEITSSVNVARIPKNIPVFLIAGDQDPVGNLGEGVKAAANQMRSVGISDIEIKLYSGMRHEILNEPGRIEVYEDIAQWIGERL